MIRKVNDGKKGATAKKMGKVLGNLLAPYKAAQPTQVNRLGSVGDSITESVRNDGR